jgi:hypothetical protein
MAGAWRPSWQGVQGACRGARAGGHQRSAAERQARREAGRLGRQVLPMAGKAIAPQEVHCLLYVTSKPLPHVWPWA